MGFLSGNILIGYYLLIPCPISLSALKGSWSSKSVRTYVFPSLTVSMLVIASMLTLFVLRITVQSKTILGKADCSSSLLSWSAKCLVSCLVLVPPCWTVAIELCLKILSSVYTLWYKLIHSVQLFHSIHRAGQEPSEVVCFSNPHCLHW